MSNVESVMTTTLPDVQRDCARVPLRYLTLVGLWDDPRAPSGWFDRHYPWLRRHARHFALAQGVYGVATQAINVAQTWGKLAQAAEYCVALLAILMACVKIRCLSVNARQMHEVVDTLNAMRASHARDDDVTHILARTRAKSDKFAHFLEAPCRNTILVMTVVACFAGYMKHSVPFRRWYPFDNNPSPAFEMTLLANCLLNCVDYYSILLFDLLFLCLLIEVIGEFRVLQHQLENIDQTGNLATEDPDIVAKPRQQLANLEKGIESLGKSRDDTKKPQHFPSVTASGVRTSWNEACTPALEMRRSAAHNEILQRRLGACIAHHQALLRLVGQLEAAFHPGIVITVLCNLCVGLTLACVTLKSDHLGVMVVNMLCIGFVCVGEFCLYCFFCTQLSTESARVGELLYSCAWWDKCAAFQSSLRIVLLRTNKPLVIRAAIIFPMSMETFTKVMNSAYNMYNLMITTN